MVSAVERKEFALSTSTESAKCFRPSRPAAQAAHRRRSPTRGAAADLDRELAEETQVAAVLRGIGSAWRAVGLREPPALWAARTLDRTAVAFPL